MSYSKKWLGGGPSGQGATEGMIWCAGEGGGELQRYSMVRWCG